MRVYAFIVAVGLAILGTVGTVNAVTIDYTSIGTFTTPSLNVGGVTVTGSADVSVSINGLGIVGAGNPRLQDELDQATDTNEWEDFSDWLGRDALDVVGIAEFLDVDSNGVFDLPILEVFFPGGGSLSTVLPLPVPIPGVPVFLGSFNVSAAVGNLPIRSFRLTAPGIDGFRVTELSFEPAPVPLPAAAWMFLTALGGLGLLRWRRRRAAA